MRKNLIALLAGTVLATVGLYLVAYASHASNNYLCFAGSMCNTTYYPGLDQIRFELWLGVGLLFVGIGSIILTGSWRINKQ